MVVNDDTAARGVCKTGSHTGVSGCLTAPLATGQKARGQWRRCYAATAASSFCARLGHERRNSRVRKLPLLCFCEWAEWRWVTCETSHRAYLNPGSFTCVCGHRTCNHAGDETSYQTYCVIHVSYLLLVKCTKYFQNKSPYSQEKT